MPSFTIDNIFYQYQKSREEGIDQRPSRSEIHNWRTVQLSNPVVDRKR